MAQLAIIGTYEIAPGRMDEFLRCYWPTAIAASKDEPRHDSV